MTVLRDFICHPIRTLFWLWLAHVMNTYPEHRVRPVYRWDWRRGAWRNPRWRCKLDQPA